MGDLSVSCIRLVQQRMPELLPASLANLEPKLLTAENMRACNNACWSLGVMAIKVPAQLLASYAGAGQDGAGQGGSVGGRGPLKCVWT